MEGLEITIMNLSNIEWQRNNWGVGAGQVEGVNWTDEITQQPAEVIHTHNGGTKASAITAHLGALVKDALYMRLGYGSSEGSFAIELRQMFHMFGIGKQSQWLHWDKSWTQATPDAAPYTWLFKSSKIVATPTLSESGAAASIMIYNR